MIRRKEEAEVIVAENVAGGNAKIYKNMMVNASEMLGMGRMVARVVLPSGSSIGEHAHVDDAELYYILKGEATVTDNDKTEILQKNLDIRKKCDYYKYVNGDIIKERQQNR